MIKVFISFLFLSLISFVSAQYVMPEIIDGKINYWISKHHVKKLSSKDFLIRNGDSVIYITEFTFTENGSIQEYRTYYGEDRTYSEESDSSYQTAELSFIDKEKSFQDKFGIWHQIYELNGKKHKMQYAYDPEGKLIYFLSELNYVLPLKFRFLHQLIRYDDHSNVVQVLNYNFSVCEYCAEWYPLFDTIGFLNLNYNYTNNILTASSWSRGYDNETKNQSSLVYETYAKGKCNIQDKSWNIYDSSGLVGSFLYFTQNGDFNYEYENNSKYPAGELKFVDQKGNQMISKLDYSKSDRFRLTGKKDGEVEIIYHGKPYVFNVEYWTN